MNLQRQCAALGAVAIMSLAVASVDIADAIPGGLVILDESGLNCIFSDTQPGTLTLHLFHTHTGGAQASQFRIEAVGGFTGVLLSSTPTPGFLTLGDVTTDYSIAYGGCQVGSFPIATVVYQVFGTSSTCSRVDIKPAPTSAIPGAVVSYSCESVLESASTLPAIINYTDGCIAWCISGTESSTWGKIKALYR